MKFGTVRCQKPGCRHAFETEFEDAAYYIDCPKCGQKALAPDDARRVMDLCPKCLRAFEDHDNSSGPMVCWANKKEEAK